MVMQLRSFLGLIHCFISNEICWSVHFPALDFQFSLNIHQQLVFHEAAQFLIYGICHLTTVIKWLDGSDKIEIVLNRDALDSKSVFT